MKSMNHRFVGLIALAPLLFSAKEVDAQPPVAASSTACMSCSEPNSHQVLIDARTGSFQGRRRFDKHETVEVVLTNKNPFLFKYQLSKVEAASKETALLPFLSLLGPVVANQVPTAAAQGINRTVLPQECPGAATILADEIKNLTNDITAATSSAKGLVAPIADLGAMLDKEVEDDQNGLKSPTADCRALCEKTSRIASNKAFMTFPALDLAQLGEQLKAVPSKAADLKNKISAYESSFPGACTMALSKAFADAKMVASTGEQGQISNQATLSKAANLAKAIKPWQVAIQAVHSDPKAFEERVKIGDYDQTTEVTIKVTTLPVDVSKMASQPADAKAAQSSDKPDQPMDLMTAKLRFGKGPFFSLSGGLAYSSITKPQFQPTQGFERTRSGALVEPETTARVIGESDTAHPLTPMLILNGRVGTWSWVSVHISLGITAKNTDSSTDVEYLVGGSIGLLDDQLFITAGLYGWRNQKLQGDQYVGQKIDMSVTTLSTSQNNHWRPGFALTYKIR